ncbi:hypothetical protein PVT68_17185 [Microbulbifer bruguierae]|uniref:Uncharacterized protein n=1 Tax=Microbulbifer bruguierae TaxID=3029061 RepID=A0ABY8NCG0_9GAMM|nr:hypothetical protein [Microbulbifer bruguierae]WGL16483.1 hypothetical protein PVT68_17185 [Microbulbifer bruguierae]
MNEAQDENAIRQNGLKKITENIRWRDLDADVAADGTVVFSSNREASEAMDIERTREMFDIYLAKSSPGSEQGSDQWALQKLTATPQDEMLPRFSPDGHRVAFVRSREQLVVLDLDAGAERVLYAAAEILDFDWSPDGHGVAIAARNSEQGKIVLALCETDCLKGLITLQELKTFPRRKDALDERPRENAVVGGSVDGVRWSPNGEWLSYIFHPDTKGVRSLHLFNVQTGKATRLSTANQQVQNPLSWSPDGQSLLYAALVDYRLYFDEVSQRKVYQGAMQLFRSDLNGQQQNLTRDQVSARAPVVLAENRIAYLQSEHLGARKFSLMVKDLNDGAEYRLFDGVSPNSILVVKP